MLQLLELLEKALAPLALLAGILFALAQTAKILLTLAQTDQVPRILKLPEGMWQKAGRAFGSWLWLALCAALGYAAWVSYVLHLGPGRGLLIISILIPGIVATGILGVVPLDKPGAPAPVEGDSLGRVWLRGAGHSGVRISRSGPDQD